MKAHAVLFLVSLWITAPGLAQQPAVTAVPAPADPKPAAEQPLRFVVTLPAGTRTEPVTGRLLLFLSPESGREPRHADYARLGPVYAVDVKDLPPGEPVVFEPRHFNSPTALAFPKPLRQLAPGAYQVQALLDLDNTIGDYNTGPGNLYSQPQTCDLHGALGGTFTLSLDKVVPTSRPQDTEWVKLVELPSRLLSDFHGRPIEQRAAVILPSTYTTEPERRYPVIYVIPGFGGRHLGAWNWISGRTGQRWQKGEVALQAIRVVLDPDTPYGHHVFANSANNGPVGDALVHEFIPEIERRFRAIPAAATRFVTGHSSGGWSSLWLQVSYPDYFGGCWSTAPDPVDFRAFQTMDLYRDRNGFWTDSGQARAVMRSRTDVELTVPALHLWEYVTGYGSQLDAFDAVFSPRGPDGRPRAAMNKLSGDIDPAVVEHWKRYDIRLVLQKNWRALKPKLRGKLHIMTGTWDTFYLNPAVGLLREFLETTDYGGYVELLPGDHGNVLTPEIQLRIENEMAETFKRYSANPTKGGAAR